MLIDGRDFGDGQVVQWVVGLWDFMQCNRKHVASHAAMGRECMHPFEPGYQVPGTVRMP
jgi:hypothetical protein